MKRSISLRAAIEGTDVSDAGIDYEGFFRQLFYAQAPLKSKLADISNLYSHNIVPACYTIKYGVIEFLFSQIESYPTKVLTTLGDIAEPSLIGVFESYAHIIERIQDDVVRYYDPNLYYKYCFFVCRYLLISRNSSVFMGPAAHILNNVSFNARLFTYEDQHLTLQLFKYALQNYFFLDFFTPMDVVDFIIETSGFAILKKQSFFKLFGELLGAHMDVYHYFMAQQLESGLLSALPHDQCKRVLCFLMVCLDYTSDYAAYPFIFGCLRYQRTPTSLNERAVLFIRKLTRLNPTILKDVDPVQICDIARHSTKPDVQKGAYRIITMMEHEGLIIGKIKHGMLQYMQFGHDFNSSDASTTS